MPRRKEVTFVEDKLENGTGQTIELGDHVMYIAKSFNKTEHKVGTYVGKYVLTDKVVSVKVAVKETFWDRRSYAILSRARVFKLQF